MTLSKTSLSWSRWLIQFGRFALFYLREVILSNARVAHDVLTPTHHMKPGFIAVPLAELSDRQVLVLANLITMTPGTLSLDVSDDRTTLYLHAMYVEDAEALRRELVELYENRIREIL